MLRASIVRAFLLAAVSFTMFAGSVLAKEQLRIVRDSDAGIKVGIPESFPRTGKRTKWGHTWASLDGGITVNSLAYAPGRTIEDIYAGLIAVSGRAFLTQSGIRNGQFILRGHDVDGSGFYIAAYVDGDTVRGLSVIYTQARRREYAGLVERIAQSFRLISSQAGSEFFSSEGARTPSSAEQSKPKIVTQLGHRGSVNTVAFSPDGKLALSGSCEEVESVDESCSVGLLKLWDPISGKELRSFVAHFGSVHSVVFSPDGKLALSGGGSSYFSSEDGGDALRLWEVSSGRMVRSFVWDTAKLPTYVTSVAFSPDGKLALSGGNYDTLKLWDVASGRELRTFAKHGDGVTSVAFSPDGKLALSGGDQMLRLWEVATGRELRTFAGHAGGVTSVAFSPDGKLALSSGNYDTLKLWEVATGRELRIFAKHDDGVTSVAFSPDGKSALSGGGDQTLRLWEVATGHELRTFTGHTGGVGSVAFSPDGKLALSGSDDQTLKLWEVASGRQLRSLDRKVEVVDVVAFSSDGRLVLSGSRYSALKLWDVTSGRQVRSFTEDSSRSHTIALSPDGMFALSVSARDQALKLWEVASGRELRTFTGHTGGVDSIAFSPDGKLALSGGDDQTLKLWEVASGRELRTFTGHTGRVGSVAFSPDGNLALSGGDDGTLRLWEVASGREMHSFTGVIYSVMSVAISPDSRFALSGHMDGKLRIWDLVSGRELRRFGIELGDNVELGSASFAFSPDGKFALEIHGSDTPSLREMISGRELRSFTGHTGAVTSAAFSPDGKKIATSSLDGTIRLWDIQTGREFLILVASRDYEQLAITPTGFFTSSRPDTDMLAVVRGLEATTIGQVHQILYNPDLVREALAGDPNGEVKRAAEVVNLEKVLESGPAPEVLVTLDERARKSNSELVSIMVQIKDRGKGIGRVEWRVNGITVAVKNAPQGPGPVYEVSQEIALDPGENVIEIIAYNAGNLLASLPARATIAYAGAGDALKPKLHVLAIGVNSYVDKGGTAPGQTKVSVFPPLNLAVGDAKALGAELQKAGSGLYSDVRVRTALDSEANAANLDAIVTEMAAGVHPRDTFVLFAAAHGYSHEGRFYLIPQDYQGGPNPKALARGAIDQLRLQDWIANRIRAKKVLILLDTCESGALTSGYVRSRVNVPASEAGVGRLHEATGRPILTAAAEGQYAHEGVIGGRGERRGIFTWAVLDAIRNGDINGDGIIELSELVAHVQNVVPGLAKGFARAVTRSEPVLGTQTPRFGSLGEDFAVVRRLQ